MNSSKHVHRFMAPISTNQTGWIEVIKSFYMTFDGTRCYCNIPELYISATSAQMLVKYRQGDEEAYHLKSQDGVHYAGAYQGTDDDSRVEFMKFTHGASVLLAGAWKCGGRTGEWYIEGFARTSPI
jgi:hypothetical protein